MYYLNEVTFYWLASLFLQNYNFFKETISYSFCFCLEGLHSFTPFSRDLLKWKRGGLDDGVKIGAFKGD